MNDTDFLIQIDEARSVHEAWVCAHDRGEPGGFPASDGDSEHCAFGKWIAEAGQDPAIRGTEPFNLVRWLHNEFHALAGEVAALPRPGRDDARYDLLSRDLAATSHLLDRALAAWRAEIVQDEPVLLFGS